MVKAKEIVDYIKEYTSSDNAKGIINSSALVNTEGFDVWSFKKLIFLHYYIKPSIQIALTNIENCKCYFIDLFSSSGANSFGEISSIGSPIISILQGVIKNKKRERVDRFSKWFFVDSNKDFCNALEIRSKVASSIIKSESGEDLIIGKDIKIIPGDCNAKIKDIINEIKLDTKEDENAYVLAFIDPYKFTDISWETWKALSSLKYVDIIFTLPIYTLQRGLPVCKGKDCYLPPSVIKEAEKDPKISHILFSKLYAKDLVELFKRSIHHYDKGISVKNLYNAEMYRIELFTHSGKASEICLEMANKLDKLSAENLNTLIEQIFKGQKTLF